MEKKRTETPLRRALEEYIDAGWSRLHMPGHKGAPIEPFGPLAAYDLTEVEGTDSLFEDDGPLKELEEIFTQLYGTRSSVISAGGSTLCIQAMLRLVAREGGKVIAGRNIHAAAVNAMALLGLEPVWVYPQRDTEERLIGRIAPADVAAALQREEDVCAVYITSPDYFGVMSDIEGIAEVAHAHGVPLLVDNAHGAHLRFLQGEDGRSLHPMQLGADLCCDSLHKTLPALTGAALLHCNREEYVPQLKGAMTVFGSTSPNYLIMLSIDSTAGFLLGDGPDQLRRTVQKWGELRRLAGEQGYPVPKHCDPMRLTLPLAGSGYTAEEFKALLHERRIMEEYCSDSGCVLLFSPFNREEDFARVRQFLLDCPVRQKGSFTPFPIVPSQRVMGLRQALLAPKESVDIDKAEGRISAQVKITCPPGIPLVMPGERLHKELRKILKNSGIFVMDVVK